MVDVNVCVLGCLKEELAWAADKWLQVISTIIISCFFKNSCRTKELK